jgi:hypothetical protein
MNWKEVLKKRKLLSLLVVAAAILATVFFLHSTMRSTTSPTPADTSIPALPTNADLDDVLQALGGTGSGTIPGSRTSNQLAYNFAVGSSVATKAGAGHVVLGSEGTGSNTVAEDFNDYPEYDYDFEAGGRGIGSEGDVGRGSDRAGSNHNIPPEDFTPILLANNDYPHYDYDFEAGSRGRGIEGGGGVGQGKSPEGTSSDIPSGGVSESEADTPPGGDGESEGDITPGGDGESEGDITSGGDGESEGDITPGGDGESEPPSQVPEPASMILLGSALVGIAVFGRKRLFRE